MTVNKQYFSCGAPGCNGPKRCEYPGCDALHANGCSTDSSLKQWTCGRHFLLGTAVRLLGANSVGHVAVADRIDAPTGTVFVQWRDGANGYYIPDHLEAVDEHPSTRSESVGDQKHTYCWDSISFDAPPSVGEILSMLIGHEIKNAEDLGHRLDDAAEYRTARNVAKAVSEAPDSYAPHAPHAIRRHGALYYRSDTVREVRERSGQHLDAVVAERDRLKRVAEDWKGKHTRLEELYVKATEERHKMAMRLERLHLEYPQASATAAAKPAPQRSPVVSVDNTFWEDGEP